jgi:hypothetical protein
VTEDWGHIVSSALVSALRPRRCNSSKNKHAAKHFHATKHPIARSIEPGENWACCYVDELLLDIAE